MNTKVFNAALLAGWFLLTLGGLLYRPDVGLMVGGLALLALTVGLALRFGLHEGKPPETSGKPADKSTAA